MIFPWQFEMNDAYKFSYRTEIALSHGLVHFAGFWKKLLVIQSKLHSKLCDYVNADSVST